MPACSGHSHNNNEPPDRWTYMATVGEAASSFLSDAYWLATLFDLASGCPEFAFGLSTYAIGFGAVMALSTASGAAYSHTMLNLNAQNNEHKREHNHGHGETHEHDEVKKDAPILKQ